MKCEFCAVASCVPVSYAASTTLCDDVTLGACQELAGGVGGGGGNRVRVTTFWDSEKGGVIKNGPLKGSGSWNICPWSCRGSPTEEKGSLLFGKIKNKTKKQEQRNIMDINCEVLLQEFNKYLLFIYNNAMDQLVTVWRPLLPIVKNGMSFSIPNIFSNTMLQSWRREK